MQNAPRARPAHAWPPRVPHRVRPDMKQSTPAASSDTCVQAFTEWYRALLEALRASALAAGPVTEQTKWSHRTWSPNAPVPPIHTGAGRVPSGFGRLKEFDDCLRQGGLHDMASIAPVGRHTRSDAHRKAGEVDPAEPAARRSPGFGAMAPRHSRSLAAAKSRSRWWPIFEAGMTSRIRPSVHPVHPCRDAAP